MSTPAATGTRSLGRCGLRVSEVGFGGMSIGGDVYGPVEDDVSRRAIDRALALGCTFFDTADTYGAGRSERLLAERLKAAAARSASAPNAVLATKGGKAPVADGEGRSYRPDALVAAFEASRERIERAAGSDAGGAGGGGGGAVGRVAVSLFQVHDPPRDVLLDPEVHRALRSLVTAGRVRAIGVSVVSVDDGIAAVECGAWDTVQVEASLLAPEAEARLLPLAAEREVGVIARVPLGHGVLSGRYGPDTRFADGDLRAAVPREELARRVELASRFAFLSDCTGRTPAQAAIRWLLDLPGVSSVVPGIRTPEQAEESMGASACPPITESERVRVREVRARP